MDHLKIILTLIRGVGVGAVGGVNCRKFAALKVSRECQLVLSGKTKVGSEGRKVM